MSWFWNRRPSKPAPPVPRPTQAKTMATKPVAAPVGGPDNRPAAQTAALVQRSPIFEDVATANAWRTARREAMDHVLVIVAESPAAEHLLLRGSLLLKSWLGEAARDPGDMDWVVTPQSVAMDNPVGKELITGLIQ